MNMKGRPKKYKKGRRILLFLDEEVIDLLDTVTKNRSDYINKLIINTLSTQPIKMLDITI